MREERINQLEHIFISRVPFAKVGQVGYPENYCTISMYMIVDNIIWNLAESREEHDHLHNFWLKWVAWEGKNFKALIEFYDNWIDQPLVNLPVAQIIYAQVNADDDIRNLC